MTTVPTPDEHLEAFAAELHRLADLITEGAVPVPTITPALSWYLHGDGAHGKAAGIARTLAPEWRANPYSSGRKYLSAVANVGGIGYDVTVVVPDAEEPRPAPPSAAFADELNASVAEVQRAQLEVVEGDPGPDLRACCDHEAHEPGECSVPGCDCDGNGPTVAVDR